MVRWSEKWGRQETIAVDRAGLRTVQLGEAGGDHLLCYEVGSRV